MWWRQESSREDIGEETGQARRERIVTEWLPLSGLPKRERAPFGSREDSSPQENAELQLRWAMEA